MPKFMYLIEFSVQGSPRRDWSLVKQAFLDLFDGLDNAQCSVSAPQIVNDIIETEPDNELKAQIDFVLQFRSGTPLHHYSIFYDILRLATKIGGLHIPQHLMNYNVERMGRPGYIRGEDGHIRMGWDDENL